MQNKDMDSFLRNMLLKEKRMFQNAKWIWKSKDYESDEYADFLTHFTAESGKSYSIKISADCDYILFCNGQMVDFGQYQDYADYKVYDTLSLDTFVRTGDNELFLTVWYQGGMCFTCCPKGAGVIFEVFGDGTSVVWSDRKTLCRENPFYEQHKRRVITGQLGFSFRYDATASDDVPYADSVEIEMPFSYFSRPIEKLKLSSRLNAMVCQNGGFFAKSRETAGQTMQWAALSCRSIGKRDFSEPLVLSCEEGEDGVYFIVDMGSEEAGQLDFELEVPNACEIVIGWGEHLEDGRCRVAVRSSKRFCCEYKAKAGKNRYLNPFRRLGCRYLEFMIFSERATVYYAGLRPNNYPLTIKPYRGSNPLRRVIYDTAVKTLQLCMHEHYEDTPWREQSLYIMDSRNEMLYGYYAFGETVFPRGNLELISHGLREDGFFMLCYPATLDYPIPSFGLVYFLQMKEYLEHSGDVEFLAGKYDFLKKLLQRYLDKMHDNGLIDNFPQEKGVMAGVSRPSHFWNFYEWSEGLDGGALGCVSSFDAPLNAYLSLALAQMAYIANVLEREDDRQRYQNYSLALNQAIVKEFYDPSTGLFRTFDRTKESHYSVLVNSLCLLCGAADGLDTSNMLQILLENGKGNYGFSVSPISLSMNGYRFDALLQFDRERFTPFVLREIDELYLKMLCEGATTFWETEKGAEDFGHTGSLCHGWSALPAYYYQILDDGKH